MKTIINTFSAMCAVLISITVSLLIAGCQKDSALDPETDFSVLEYYPSSGRAGTLVTIGGEGFGDDQDVFTVTFNGNSADILSVTDEQIVVRAPSESESGKIEIRSGDRSVEVGDYRYQSLSLQRISPERAQAGARVQLIGEGFGGVGGPATAFINGKEATVASASDTILEVLVPKDVGNGPVKVSVDGQESSGQNFTFMAIREVKPLTGGAGTRITIKGEGFVPSAEGNTIQFNGRQGRVLQASVDSLVVQAVDDVSTGELLVLSDGQPVSGPVFSVVAPPTITEISPLSAPAGTEMVIRGTTFSENAGETHVFIGSKEIPLTEVTGTEIKLRLPADAGTGKVTVSVNDQVAVGDEFRTQNLGIINMSPDNGLAGTEVTISGVGFSTNPGENTVTFSGIAATVLSATDSQLRVQVPDGVSTGLISVRARGLEAKSPRNFNRAGVTTFGRGQLQLSADGGSIAVDNQDNVYVLEAAHNRIMKITPNGQVSLFAGSASGMAGNRDGTGSGALFSFSANSGLVFDSNWNLYVSDNANRAIRKIGRDGTVSTLFTQFTTDIGKITIVNNLLYVEVDSYNGKISSSNSLYVIEISRNNFFNIKDSYDMSVHPRPAVMNNDFYCVPRSKSGLYYRIAKYGAERVFTFAGSSSKKGYVDGIGGVARFGRINGILPYDASHLLVLDAGNRALRTVEVTTAVTETLLSFEEGFQDGDFRTAKFSTNLTDFALGTDGSVYILDNGNNAVRKVFFR